MNEIHDKIQHGEYALPTPPEKTRKRDAWTAYRAECAKVTERFKADLIAAYSMTDHPQAERIYAFAEDYANGAGLAEIANYFDDLAGLISDDPSTPRNASLTEQLLYDVHSATHVSEENFEDLGYFVNQDLAHKAATSIPHGTVEKQLSRVVLCDGKVYRLGEEVQTSFRTPDEIKASARAKVKSAGLTAEEAKSIGVALTD